MRICLLQLMNYPSNTPRKVTEKGSKSKYKPVLTINTYYFSAKYRNKY